MVITKKNIPPIHSFPRNSTITPKKPFMNRGKVKFDGIPSKLQNIKTTLKETLICRFFIIKITVSGCCLGIMREKFTAELESQIYRSLTGPCQARGSKIYIVFWNEMALYCI